MSQETAKVKLTIEEFQNFRAIAEEFNVDYQYTNRGDQIIVTAPKDKLDQWGYLDEEPE